MPTFIAYITHTSTFMQIISSLKLNNEAQREIGQYFGVCKASVYNVIKTVVNAVLDNLCNVSSQSHLVLVQYNDI